jgi:hypothetical protein
MIENDLRELESGAIDHPLDRLESDVWQGVAMRTRARSAARELASLQGLLLLLSMLGSVAAGVSVAHPVAGSRSDLMPGMEFMPSHLLLHRQS